MEYKIEKKIERILILTGGSSKNQAKNDASSFKWLNNSFKFTSFNRWFCEYINDDNCLTADELREYEALKLEGPMLTEEELDSELNKFYESPHDTLIPFDEMYLTSLQEEFQEVSEQVETMKKAHEYLLNDIKKTGEELVNTKSMIDAAKKMLSKSIEGLYPINKQLCEQLEKVKQQSLELQEHLLQLKDHLTHEDSKLNMTNHLMENNYSLNPSMMRSFDSSLKSLQEQYLIQMKFSKYELLIASFLEDLNLFIKKQFYKSVQNNDIEEGSGDFTNSTSLINFNGININVQMEFKRLSESLCSTKQEMLKTQAEVMRVNRAIGHIKQLLNDLVIKKWEPTLIKLKLTTLDLKGNIEELENDMSCVELKLIDCCREWTDRLIQRVMKDLLLAKIARKTVMIGKIDELLDMLLTQEAYSMCIWILIEQEQQRIISSASFISEICSLIESEVNDLREQKILIDSNYNDYNEYMSKPEIERNELARRMASLMKTEVVDLPMKVAKLQNKITTDEITLIKQYANQVHTLCKMKNSLMPLKHHVFSGPVNKACVVNEKFYSELQNMEERIAELAFSLLCTKNEFLKTKSEILKDPERELKLLWIKFLVQPEEMKELKIKSEPLIKSEEEK